MQLRMYAGTSSCSYEESQETTASPTNRKRSVEAESHTEEGGRGHQAHKARLCGLFLGFVYTGYTGVRA
jgi:hypothetical protein